MFFTFVFFAKIIKKKQVRGGTRVRTIWPPKYASASKRMMKMIQTVARAAPQPTG